MINHLAVLQPSQPHRKPLSSLARLLREARLCLSACLEDIEVEPLFGLGRSILRSLGTGRWIEDRQNVLIAGPPGVGKTFITCALANAACRLGFSAR